MFFYNSGTTVAASGRLEADGNFTELHEFPAGQFGAGWTHIVG